MKVRESVGYLVDDCAGEDPEQVAIGLAESIHLMERTLPGRAPRCSFATYHDRTEFLDALRELQCPHADEAAQEWDECVRPCAAIHVVAVTNAELN